MSYLLDPDESAAPAAPVQTQVAPLPELTAEQRAEMVERHLTLVRERVEPMARVQMTSGRTYKVKDTLEEVLGGLASVPMDAANPGHLRVIDEGNSEVWLSIAAIEVVRKV